MSVAAINHLSSPGFCVLQGACLDIRGKPQPGGAQFVEQANQAEATGANLLQHQVNEAAQAAEQRISHQEAIELMAMNRHVALAAILPDVLLINLHSHQVREHVGKAFVVVALNPHHFDSPLRIRKFSDVRKEVPMLLLQTGEVQITKDIAQKDQLVEAHVLQHLERIGGPASLRPQVQVRDDQRVADLCLHPGFSCTRELLSRDEAEVKSELGIGPVNPCVLWMKSSKFHRPLILPKEAGQRAAFISRMRLRTRRCFLCELWAGMLADFRGNRSCRYFYDKTEN